MSAYVNAVCVVCATEVSAHLHPEKVFVVDGGPEKFEAQCLKCNKPIEVWITADSKTPEAPPDEKPAVKIELGDVEKVKRQLNEIAKSYGFNLSWRKA